MASARPGLMVQINSANHHGTGGILNVTAVTRKTKSWGIFQAGDASCQGRNDSPRHPKIFCRSLQLALHRGPCGGIEKVCASRHTIV
jgi:hypothetical protein